MKDANPENPSYPQGPCGSQAAPPATLPSHHSLPRQSPLSATLTTKDKLPTGIREPVQEEKLRPPDRDKGEAIYLDGQQGQVGQGQLQPPLGTRYSSEQSPQGTAGPLGQYRSPTLPRVTDGGAISVRPCLLRGSDLKTVNFSGTGLSSQSLTLDTFLCSLRQGIIM